MTGPTSNPVSRVPSSTGAPIQEEKEDAKSSDNVSVDTPSPPRRVGTTIAMTGKGMRPLTLVQNEEEAMRARKAANRGSWLGWFGQDKQKENEANAQ
jgi:hypothetical protein